MINVHADTLRFTLPTSLNEVTYGQYRQVINLTSVPEIVQVLSSKSREELRALRAPDLYALSAEHLQFITELPTVYSLPKPAQVSLRGRSVTTPKDISVECTIGQWSDVAEELKAVNLPDEGVSLDQVAPTLLGIFLAPLITGEPYTDVQQAYDVLEDIDTLPCTEAMPLAAFFLSSYLAPTPSGMVSFEPCRPLTTKQPKWLQRLRPAFRAFRTTIFSAS